MHYSVDSLECLNMMMHKKSTITLNHELCDLSIDKTVKNRILNK